MPQWTLAKPLIDGELRADNFRLREIPVPHLRDGEALVRVRVVNIHAGTRRRILTGRIAVGATDPSNFACGEVIRSRDPAFAEGDVVACQAGWQEYQVIRGADGPIGAYPPPTDAVSALNRTRSPWTYVFRPELAAEWPADVLMDVFGTSGLTAYFGLRQCGPLGAADSVAVSGITGGVGSLAAQLAKAAGCRVVGFAGTAERCHWAVDHLGADECLNYRSATLGAELDKACPDGLSAYADGAGGGLTEAVVPHLNPGGTLVSYGSSSAFYAPAETAQRSSKLDALRGLSPAIEALMAQRNIRNELWFVSDFYAERLRAEDELASLLRSGALTPVNTVIDGLENLPAALITLYGAAVLGKLQVRFN